MAVEALTETQRTGRLILEKVGASRRTTGSVSSSQLSTLLPTTRDARPSISDLEKHLDDYKKGLGYLSAPVAEKLGALDQKNSFKVSPRDLTSYLTYSTALSYEGRAYYVSSIDQTTKTIDSLQHPTTPTLPTLSKEQALSRYRAG